MLTIALIGPLPPPAGGMAMQCLQLERLLRSEGMAVNLVQTNAPFRPAWVGRVWGLRALFRLLPYLASLWRAGGSADVFHLLANSGWAWHLFAAPAVWIARMRRVPVIVNYRGGEAERFFERSFRLVHRTMLAADARVVPSAFLQQVFRRFGIDTRIIPNIVDVEQFRAERVRQTGAAPRIVVARNLEEIYDIATALRAFVFVCERLPGAQLIIAGEGPERARLEALAVELRVGNAITFAGRLGRQEMAALYADADLMLNPSTVDNMPNSILEAYAAGLPVVSTNVGGITHMARDGVTALLVPARDPAAMAQAACRVLLEPDLAARLVQEGLREARRHAWSEVRKQWLPLYRELVGQRGAVLAQEP